MHRKSRKNRDIGFFSLYFRFNVHITCLNAQKQNRTSPELQYKKDSNIWSNQYWSSWTGLPQFFYLSFSISWCTILNFIISIWKKQLSIQNFNRLLIMDQRFILGHQEPTPITVYQESSYIIKSILSKYKMLSSRNGLAILFWKSISRIRIQKARRYDIISSKIIYMQYMRYKIPIFNFNAWFSWN